MIELQLALPLGDCVPNETPTSTPESSELKTAERLRALTRPDMVQVAPGRWSPRPGKKPPEFTVASWKNNGDGTYTAVPHEERMIRLTRKLADALGFQCQLHTFYRLGNAGFIELLHPAPGRRLLNLDSWYNHLRRVAEDPDFWSSDGKNLKAYREAQGWIDPKTRKETAGVRKRAESVKSRLPRKGP